MPVPGVSVLKLALDAILAGEGGVLAVLRPALQQQVDIEKEERSHGIVLTQFHGLAYRLYLQEDLLPVHQQVT